jgi:hypothetical protein
MTSMNNWIWAIGLVLQCALLGALVKRSVARRFPFFTSLIGLYILRSVFLFTAFGHLSAAAYTLSNTTLSLTDVALQVLVAWELFTGGHGSLLYRLAVFFALVAISAVATWGISSMVPANPRSPIDRGVLFPCVLMLMVAAVTVFRSWGSYASARLRVLEGFAVLAAAGIVSQIGRTLAALDREPRLYMRWSYTEAIAYLAVLLWWLGTVHDDGRLSPSYPLRRKRNAPLLRPQSAKKSTQPKGET